MVKQSTITSFIFGASIGLALLRFYSMSKEERDAFFNHLKKTTNDLLDNADTTVEKVEHFMSELKSKEKNEWMGKLYVLKKMFNDFYGTQKKYLL